ncbi:MAG: hypothetical protein AUK16_03030 [Parcubacteria group bacterium CG2_30_44_11]|nr:MAG: hypothetical protein AUK16_03030 [Parcubacteria group bacterium CG2_30_44_11]
MSKRKKSAVITPQKSFFDDLNPQTKQAIGAVLMLFMAILLSLALFGKAGMVGDWIKVSLTFLFGDGSYLAPLVCLFYVYAFLNPKDDEQVSTSKVMGIALFFVACLGYLALYEKGLGGISGSALAFPLSYLMGNLAAGIILTLILLIGVFLTFDTSLHLAHLFKKKEPVLTTDDIEKIGAAQAKAAKEEPPEETELEEMKVEETQKKGGLTVVERLGFVKGNSDFAVSSFEGPYAPPPLSLLSKGKGKANTGDIKARANTIKQTLRNFGIEVEMDQVEVGPAITRYALKPAQGVKIARIVGLQRELELGLAAGTIRIEAPIPGKSLVGIEVPNIQKALIGLASLMASPEFTDSPNPLMVTLGKDIAGKAHFANVARMPHGLIAGTTGSGKSVMIHSLIISLLYRNSPEQLRFIMVDPKRVELTLYDGIPHLMSPVITDAKKALLALKWAVKEMERRYDILQSEKVQNIASYHKNIYQPAKSAHEAELKVVDSTASEAKGETDTELKLPEALPYIVIVMDELADLMHAYPRELEAAIVRLAQMSRAVGIHLLIATQRPSVNVITGTIKANIPTRMAFQVASQIDSRTIIDMAGAEKLLGQGDMLFLSGELSKPTRLLSAFVSEEEVKRVVEFLKHQTHTLDSIDFDAKAENGGEGSIYGSELDGNDEDELYDEAKQIVTAAGKASTSFLQRRLRIGYSRAARLIDLLEEREVVGHADGAKPREIIGAKVGDNDSDTSEENYT